MSKIQLSKGSLISIIALLIINQERFVYLFFEKKIKSDKKSVFNQKNPLMSCPRFSIDLHRRQKGLKEGQSHRSYNSQVHRHHHRHYHLPLFDLCRSSHVQNRWVILTTLLHPLSFKTCYLFNVIVDLQTMTSYQTKPAVHFSSLLEFSIVLTSFSVFLHASLWKDYCELLYD